MSPSWVALGRASRRRCGRWSWRLAETHDPRDVQVYCLDFGGGSLSSLRALPHVGSVAGRLDVDLIRRTIGQLESLLRAREARRSSGESAAADDPYGDVFLVIDGWATIRQEFDTLEASITALAAQGLSYGIHVVVAASRWAEIRPALKDQIGTRIELRLGDPADSEMDRKRARQLVQSPPGRGITRDGHELVIALPRFDDVSADRLRTRYGGRVAPPVRAATDACSTTMHSITAVTERAVPTQILLGIGEAELLPVAVDFAAEAHLIILGEAECGKTHDAADALPRNRPHEHRELRSTVHRRFSPDAARRRRVRSPRGIRAVGGGTHTAAGQHCWNACRLGRPAQTSPSSSCGCGRGGRARRSMSSSTTTTWWLGATGNNPLAPLLDFLPHAKDLGLHVVVARRSGGAARAMFDPVLARLRDLGCMGLMMSASPDDGVLLGSVRPVATGAGSGNACHSLSPGSAHPGRLERHPVTECVVEVGPGTVRGRVRRRRECGVDGAGDASTMRLRCSTTQPVAVAAVWREVFRSVLPDDVDTAVLVCPTWWPSVAGRVRAGSRSQHDRRMSSVLQRAEVLIGDVARDHDRHRDCARVRGGLAGRLRRHGRAAS